MVEIFCVVCQKQVEFYKSERTAWIACYWCDYYKVFNPEDVESGEM